MKNVSISFRYTKDEFVKAMQKYLEISGTIGTGERWVLTLSLAIDGVLIIRQGINTLTLSLSFLIALFTLWALWLYFQNPKSSYKKALRLTENYLFTFSQDKISFKSDKAAADFKWKSFKKLYETEDFFYLVQSKHSYSMLPKRAFASPKDMEDFKKIAGLGNSSMEYKYPKK